MKTSVAIDRRPRFRRRVAINVKTHRKIAVNGPAGLSYGELKLLPLWDPVRGDPRFEKIVASLAPKEASK